MKKLYHPSLEPLVAVLQGVEVVTREMVREASRRIDKRRARAGRGGTLRPSAETPLWNAVISMVRPHLQNRGSRALLARELGVHRARIGEFFSRQSAMPDAERTLLLLLWLSRQTDPTSTQRRQP